MARNPFAKALVTICPMLVLASLTSPAGGQGFFRPTRAAQSGQFIEAPRSIQQQLRESQRSLDEGRYSDAVVRLGDLLSADKSTIDELDLAGQDFFLNVSASRESKQTMTSSLFRTAREMIGRLPESALETYELRYGPLARKLLSEAAQSRDWEKVREVRRKYFHTKAGYEASFLLAEHEMFGGHPLAASLLLDNVVAVPRAIDHLGPGVQLLHASALKLAGRGLPKLDSRSDPGEVVVGGETHPWPNQGELSDWLARHFGRIEDLAGGQPLDYPLFGGRPNRNGASSGQLPLTNLRWMLDTTASPRQERSVRRIAEELTTSGKLPPPSWVPLRVGQQLLMRTTERLVGVDYRTGKRVWTYPWQSAYEFFDEEDFSLDGLVGPNGASDLLSQRVWNDVPYGHITSDGKRVFILDDLREVEMATFSPMINLRGTRPADTGTNTLVALDLATEGKLLWRLGAGADEVSGLSDAFFLGPPLPLDGRLYVMVEIAGDINLSCLDPATGNELWRQQLVAVESGGIDTDPIRRVAGAMPSYHQGILICPTGAGALVAIDLADQMLRWGVRYDRDTEMIRGVSGRGRGLEPRQLMQRWFSGAAIADEGALLVTPIESDHLFGFNLLTGESLFEKKPRVHLRYLAGIRNGRFFVAGRNEMRAFDLQSGDLIWTTPRDMLAAGQQISGCGVFGQGEYFIPTTANQIVQVSLEDGSVIDRRNTRYPLGNLVAVDGEVIAQGATSLAVAFGETTLEPLVNRMLEQNPNDFDALVRKSELLIQHGDRDRALELLSRARKMQPDNVEVRMLSVSAMLGMLRDSVDGDSGLVETLDKLIDRPAERVELLSLRVRSALMRQDRLEAARRLIDLSSLIVSEPLLEASAGQIVNDSSRQCSLDGWLAARVNELVAESSDEELATMNRLLGEQVESKYKGSTNLLKRIVRHFGSLEGIQPIRRELSERFRTDEEFLQWERLVLGTDTPTASGLEPLSTERLLLLADVYASGGLPRDAKFVIDQVTSRDVTSLEPRIEEIRQLADRQISVETWPRKVSLTWESHQSRIRTISLSQRVAETKVSGGVEFEGWRLVSEGARPLSLRDPTGLLRTVPMEGRRMDDTDKEAQICGGMMVVVMPNGLVGIDLYHLLKGDGEAMMWRRGLSGDSGPVAKRRSSMTPFDDQVVRYYIASGDTAKVIPEFKLGPIMGDRVLLLQGGDLLAIDLFTAETLWRNSGAPQSGVVLSDGERVAVVSPATSQIMFFDLLDGQKLDTAEWQHGEIWESCGTHVLSYVAADEKNRYELRLVDPLTGQVVLRHETFSANRSSSSDIIPCAYGRVVAGRYLAVLDNQGQAIVWDLLAGREIGRPKLPAYANLQGLQVMMLDQQLILLPKRRVDRVRAPQARQVQTTAGSFHRTVHGVHAVSLQDGKLRWGQQFEQPWGCTLTQPAETPILVLNRSPFTYSTTSRRKSMDVLALDVRDGSELNKRVGRSILSNNNELETRLTLAPGRWRVIAQIGTERLTYQFGGDGVEETTEPKPE